LLGRCSTTSAIPPALFYAEYFVNYLPGLALILDPPDLYLPSS
jgi:hypothetical protein